MHALRIGLGFLLTTICVFPATVAAQDTKKPEASPPTTQEKLDSLRTLIEKWHDTSRIISKEKKDWRLGKETLRDRVDVVKSEIETLRKQLAGAEKSISEADKKKVELVQQNEVAKQAAIGLGKTIQPLETRTRSVLARLPEVLRERVRRLSQRLPEKSSESKKSLSFRFASVIGILNEVDKFNREISTNSEVRKLGDGRSAEVTTLYIGLGHAYYATNKGDAAGIGTASKEGWVWSPANKFAKDIGRALAVLKNEHVPAFVRLPIRIQ